MAISNELSSEIAAAMLAENKSPEELKELSEIVLQVHKTLQNMSERNLSERRRARAQTAEHFSEQNHR